MSHLPKDKPSEKFVEYTLIFLSVAIVVIALMSLFGPVLGELLYEYMYR